MRDTLKMKPPGNSSVYLPVNGNIATQQLLFNHMSNHYRRLYSAKSKVDSSVPLSYHLAVHKDEGRRRSRQAASYSQTSLHCPAENSIKLIQQQNQPELRCTCSDSVPASSLRQARSRYRSRSGEKKELETPVRSSRNSSASSTRANNKANTRPRSSSRNSSGSRHVGDAASSRSRSASRKKVDLIEEHAQNFIHLKEPFTPRILKTDAQSKLLGLKVYHPPRRRRKNIQESFQQKIEKEDEPKSPSSTTDSGASSAHSEEQLNGEEQVPHCTCSQEAKPPSRVSSRDSAYSGGVASPGESRGPTPEQQNQEGDIKLSVLQGSSAVVYQMMNSSSVPQLSLLDSSGRDPDVRQKIPLNYGDSPGATCGIITTPADVLLYQREARIPIYPANSSTSLNIRQKLKDSFVSCSIDIDDILAEIDGIIDEKTLLEELVGSLEISSISTSSPKRRRNVKSQAMEKRLEDAAYVKFVHDITEDILAKEEYSDAGLQVLFEKHIAENMHLLDMGRMRQEVMQLSAKLGIADGQDTAVEI